MTGFSETVEVDKIKMTMHVTMTISEWKSLREQLDNDKYPSASFISLVCDLIRQADRHFYQTQQ